MANRRHINTRLLNSPKRSGDMTRLMRMKMIEVQHTQKRILEIKAGENRNCPNHRDSSFYEQVHNPQITSLRHALLESNLNSAAFPSVESMKPEEIETEIKFVTEVLELINFRLEWGHCTVNLAELVTYTEGQTELMLKNALLSLNENPQVDEALEIARRLGNVASLTIGRFAHMMDMPVEKLIRQHANLESTERSLRGIKNGTDEGCEHFKKH